MRWAVLLVLCSCNLVPEETQYVPCTELASSLHITCETFPDLCRRPTTTIATSNDARAYHLTFLPEGFTEAQLPELHRHIRELVTDLWNEEGGIIEMAPELFDVHIVDLATADRPSLSSLIVNGSRYDTPLGGCLADDPLQGDPNGQVDVGRAWLAAGNAPGMDAIIVIFANGDPHPNATGNIIVMGPNDNAKTLTHELGHALFGLGDEYTLTPERYYERRLFAETGPWDLLGVANLTLDGGARKWANVMHGAVEGGARYGKGIFHPTDQCRMGDSSASEFCRVCESEIRERIALRRDPTLDDGPPTCVLGSRADPMDLKAEWTYEVRVFDRTGPVSVWVALDNVVTEQYGSVGDTAWMSRKVEVRPGKHVLTAQCTDRFGSTTNARLEAFAH